MNEGTQLLRRRKGGVLSSEDLELWRKVTLSLQLKQVNPKKNFAGTSGDTKIGRPTLRLTNVRTPITKHECRAELKLQPRVEHPIGKLDKRHRRKIGRAIDAKIDLHGMTQQVAHEALVKFLRNAQLKDSRIVLVITGKGYGKTPWDSCLVAEHVGVLRRMVPHWLAAVELRNVILGFEEAVSSHGGSGALYVRLRKRHS